MAIPNSFGLARTELKVALAAQNFELAKLAHENLLRIDPEFDANEPALTCQFELLRIIRRYRSGEEDEALEEIRALIGRFPDMPGPARHYSEWLGRRARVTEALSLVDVWRKRLPADAGFALREVQLLRQQGDSARAWGLCDDLIQSHSLLEAAWIERLLLSAEESYRHLWRETAERAAALFPGSLRVVVTIYDGAIECGEFDFMSAILQAFLENCPDSLRGYRLAANFYLGQAAYSTALNVIDAGWSRFPDDYSLLLSRLQVSRALGQAEADLASGAQALLRHAEVNEGGVYYAVSILLDAGENDLLGTLLRDVVRDDLLASGARDAAVKTLNSLPVPHGGSRANGGMSKFGGEVVLRLPPKVRHVVLAFNGLAGGLPADLLQPVFDKFGLGAIFLNDRQKLVFLNGVSELGDDYDKTLNALRDLLPDTVTTVSCLGNSAGGYAALRYAVDLNASSVLLFAPPTNLDADACACDGRARIVAKRIHKVVPQQAVNLAPLLALSAHRPKVHLWYGGAMQQDREHALNMAGVPGVVLHEVPGYEGHDVIRHLTSAGRLEDIVRQAIIN